MSGPGDARSSIASALRRVLRTLPPLAILAAAAAGGAYVHELNLEPTGAATVRAGGTGSILGSAQLFEFRKVDPADGQVQWEARGVTATPEGDRGWLIEEPVLTLYQVDGRVVTPTTIAGAVAHASFPQVADATVRVERGVTVRRGALEIAAEDIVAVMPHGSKRPEETARLSTSRPVRLTQASPLVDAAGSGLAADGALRRIILSPPVRLFVDPAALEGTTRPPGPERMRLDTASPVEVTESGTDAYEIAFTGPVDGGYQRGPASAGAPPPAPLSGQAPYGGKLRVKRRDAKHDPAATLRAAESARFRDAEVREGDVVVARGADLTWSGASATAILEGDALLRDAGEGKRSVVRARRIEYRADPAGSSATLTGDVVSTVETPTYTAVVRADAAEVAFAPHPTTASAAAGARAPHGPRASDAIVPGPLREIHARGNVEGEFHPVTVAASPKPPTATARGSSSLDSEREAALESVWHLEADEAVLGFRAGPLGEREVGTVALVGAGRQALLTSAGPDPERSYRIQGDRIEADRALGTAAVRPAPGTASRQTLERGPYRVEAREARFDERAREARASGEAILSKLHPCKDFAFRSESQEALVRFAIAPTATAAKKPGDTPPGGAGIASLAPEMGRPESFLLSGPGGVRATIVPELLSATAIPVPPSERKPISIAATRVSGEFGADAQGRPSLATVLAEGAPGAPVEVMPAYDAPRDQRFKLTAEGARYDAASNEVRLLGTAPVIARGEERVTAPVCRFRVAEREAILEGGVRGRIYLRLPEETEERLVDFSSERAIVRLSQGKAGAQGDSIASLDALGKVRLRSPDGVVDVAGDAIHYARREGRRWVRLEGRPLSGRFGKNELSGDDVEFPVPEETKHRKPDAREPGSPASSIGSKEK